MADAIYIYYHGGTTPVFTLDNTTLSIHNARSTENFNIPGQPWNTWFDNINVNRQWVIKGKFRAADNDWNPSTFQGRPLDFIHQLGCVLNGINPNTGLLVYGGGFDIEIRQYFNGTLRTYRTNTLFTQSSNGLGPQPIIMLLNSFDPDLEGGVPGAVGFSITFDEVGEIVNMGIA